MPADTSDLLRVRPSSTSRWTDCARRSVARAYPEILMAAGYALRQIPSSIGAVIGTSVHAGGAELLKEKMGSGSVEQPQRGVEAGHAAFITELDTGKDISWDETTRNRNDAARQIQRMVNVYARDVAAKVMPISVEQRLEAIFGEPGKQVLISGQADAMAIFPNAIRDTKTGKMAGWNVPQYGCYSALGRAHKNRIEICAEDFIPRVSMRQEQPAAKSVEFDRGQCEKAASAIVGMMHQQITAFIEDPKRDPWAFPANPSSMLCSDKFCPAWRTSWCSAWAEKVK